MTKSKTRLLVLAVFSALVLSGLKISVSFDNAKASSTAARPVDTKFPISPDLVNASAANFKSIHSGPNAKLDGMGQSGKYFVSFGPEPDYFLTKSPAGGTPQVLVSTATMNAIPIPKTNRIIFTGIGNNHPPYPVYVVNDDGTNLEQIGDTPTPWRLQVTNQGLAAYRQGNTIVVYNAVSRNKTSLPGITAVGEYSQGDTMWNISPDGKKIAVREGDTLTLVDEETGLKRTVQGSLDRRRETVGEWSPDSKTFVYGTEPRSSKDNPALWVASPENAERLLLEYPQSTGMFWHIAWVNPQRLIAEFVPNGPVASVIPNVEFYAVTVNGGAKLLFTNGFGISVTPDGKRAFIRRQTVVGSLKDFEVVQADLQM